MPTRMQELGIDGYAGYKMTDIDPREQSELIDKAQELYKAEFGYRANLEDLYSWLHEDMSPMEFGNYYACEEDMALA